jgi:ABC-type multidrug transport system fused ATPase/permease subunit
LLRNRILRHGALDHLFVRGKPRKARTDPPGRPLADGWRLYGAADDLAPRRPRGGAGRGRPLRRIPVVEDGPPVMAQNQGYLAAHAVEKSFAGRKVVKGAAFYVRRGEAVGLLGPNGAGKTTVFYMITGPDQGRPRPHRARRP